MGDVLLTRLVVALMAAYAGLLMVAVCVHGMTGKYIAKTIFLVVTCAAGEGNKKSEEVKANVHLCIILTVRYAALTKLYHWQYKVSPVR